jgi:hypothetical protein
VVCSYLNNLEQGQTETVHAIRELISKPLSSMIAILDKQGVEEGGRLETPASCQSSVLKPARSEAEACHDYP